MLILHFNGATVEVGDFASRSIQAVEINQSNSKSVLFSMLA